MKDPKAIRKAIMTAKSVAGLIDPHFGRIPLPGLDHFGAAKPVPEHSAMVHEAYRQPDPEHFAGGGDVGAENPYARPNPQGLYSHGAVVASTLPQERASPEQMKGMLLNRGVKPAEMQHSDFDEAFAGRPQVSREDLAKHFHRHQPKISPVIYGAPSDRDFAEMDARHRQENEELWARQHAARDAGDPQYEKFRKERNEMFNRHYHNRDRVLEQYRGEENPPKYGDYTLFGDTHLPEENGSTNYREKLLTLPPRPGSPRYESSHFPGEENPLVHLRLSDRRDRDNADVLHMEELQSDWGQQGRRSGFKGNERHDAQEALSAYLEDLQNRTGDDVFPIFPHAAIQTAESVGEREKLGDLLSAASNERRKNSEAIDPAPYVTNTNDWVDLGLKHALHEAASKGYDKLAWTPGDIHNARYDLSKHIGEIVHEPGEKGHDIQIYDPRGQMIHGQKGMSPEEIERVIGKELAAKIVAGEGEPMDVDPNSKVLGGLDLKVGGEGMRKFYDELLPKRLMRLAKAHDPEARLSHSAIPHPGGEGEVHLPALEITPQMRESILKRGFPAFAQGGEVSGYEDPASQHISEWNWRPLEDVHSDLGHMREIPSHVLKFGDFMDETARRAGERGLTPRDLIKAYTITRSSIQRRAAKTDRVRQAGLPLHDFHEEMIRPEGAFGEWLHTAAGQAYLDAAEKGQIHSGAIENAVRVMAPFGKHEKDILDALAWAAAHLPGNEGRVSELIHAGRLKSSSPEQWREFTKDIRGIGPSKSGFYVSLLGRGDQPTLDARQIILHTGRPTKEATSFLSRKGGQGGVEAVNRLTARQEAMGLDLPEHLSPYYQHLAHHAVWDRAGGDETTHEDVMRSMRHAASGGAIEPHGHWMGEIFDHLDGSHVGHYAGGGGVEEHTGAELMRRDPALAEMPPEMESHFAGAHAKPLGEMSARYIRHGQMEPWREKHPEELAKEGAIIFPALGDLTMADRLLTHVGGKELTKPVELTGGGEYQRVPHRGAWASRAQTAAVNAAKMAKQNPEGRPAYMAHTTMGLPSGDSSHMMAQGLLRLIPSMPVSKKAASAFDANMRKSDPQWPGIMNTELAEKHLLRRDSKGGKDYTGTRVSNFLKLFDKAGLRSLGFPGLGELRFATAEKRLLGAPQLSSGFSLAHVDTSGRTHFDPERGHETYSGILPKGETGYAGGFRHAIPASVMFLDWFKRQPEFFHRKATGENVPITKTMLQQALMTQHPGQVANQEWLDAVMPEYEKGKKWGYKSGGQVSKALAIAKSAKRK